MATKIEIANRLGKAFVQSVNKQEGADIIIRELKSLTYENTNTKISNEDKLEILKLISEFISGKRLFQYGDGGRVIITEQKDNSNYLDVLDYIFINVKN
ncbi:hypothetical protein G1J88_11390 [Tenacibaculum dicentrarchi]|uniref:hypothetical protein n=1 Tax=Tenacibaculum piscium TaxID=1458515 RepID=UPI001EFEDC70|nr:hypothetical protein [Tenacibaculum piscium]MCG8828983.1 hypothetical protein [Tenacibaculum dicentrarchi]